MPSGSADATFKSELGAAARLVAATKLALFFVLWFYECTTRAHEGIFAVNGPIALRALERWDGRQALFVADGALDAIDPFSSEPVAAHMPLPRLLYRGANIVASTLHLERPTIAVLLTFVLLIPTIAFLRATAAAYVDRRPGDVALILLLGPGAWYLSAPGPIPLLLLGLAAAFYGIERGSASLAALGAILGALSHPAGVLLAPCLAAAGFATGGRRRFIAVALVPLGCVAGLVAYYRTLGYEPSIVWAPLRHGYGWLGGGIDRLGVAFADDHVGVARILDRHALVSAFFILGGSIAAPATPAFRALAIGSLFFFVRDWTSATAIAAWSVPAAIGWARLLARLSLASWVPVVAALGAFPLLIRTQPHILDWFAAEGRPVVAGDTAWAGQRNDWVGLPREPQRRLPHRPGTAQAFDHGVITCTLAHGCRALENAAVVRSQALGGACGLLTRDRTAGDDGINVYTFEHGTVRVKQGAFSEAVCAGQRSYAKP